jgi:hypothetical protein
VHHIRSERRITFGARKFIDPRGRIDSPGNVLAPKMIRHHANQLSKAIAHLGVAIVRSQFNGAEKPVGRVIAGAPNSDAAVSLPQKINWH